MVADPDGGARAGVPGGGAEPRWEERRNGPGEFLPDTGLWSGMSGWNGRVTEFAEKKFREIFDMDK